LQVLKFHPLIWKRFHEFREILWLWSNLFKLRVRCLRFLKWEILLRDEKDRNNAGVGSLSVVRHWFGIEPLIMREKTFFMIYHEASNWKLRRWWSVWVLKNNSSIPFPLKFGHLQKKKINIFKNLILLFNPDRESFKMRNMSNISC